MKYALLAAVVCFATPSYAIEVNFSAPITDLDGAPIRKCSEATPACKVAATLADISANALLAPENPKSPPILGEEKAARFALALRVHKGGLINLTVEELATLKRLIGESYAPLVVGRANEILDPSASHK